jgi:hypothetical protein
MYTYTTFWTALAIEMAVPNAAQLGFGITPSDTFYDAQFVAILPTLCDQAELRCYRDLDLLFATSTATIALTPGSSKLDFSTLSPNLIILEDVNLVLPATISNPELGERAPVYPTSKEWLRMVFGVSGTQGPPAYYAMSDDHTLLFGPFPDLGYTCELIGKYRPVPLYNAPPGDGSQTTILTELVPDLFLAAAMVAAAAYQKNFGAQSDDPRAALSWEQNYQTLLGPAKSEEMRKKYHGWMGMTAEIAPAPAAPGTPGPP